MNTRAVMAIPVVAAAAALAGCFTVYQTEYPAVESVTAPEGKTFKVQVSGFEATVTTYVPVYGYETVVGHVPAGPYRRYGSCVQTTTIATETYLPRTESTAVFRDRAVEALERAGFTLQDADPEYRVDVRFVGPYVSNTDRTVSFLWNVLSLLSADYGAQTWTAKLKVYEAKTGKPLHYRDFNQKYQVAVWGPLPLFSPSGATETSYNAMQSWSLSALTDVAAAAAAEFISKQPR